MNALFTLIDSVIYIIWLVILVWVIFSWLVSFNIINVRNNVVMTVYQLLYRLTEPMLRPIRKILPNFGGIDFSPVVLLLLLFFVRQLLRDNWLDISRLVSGA